MLENPIFLYFCYDPGYLLVNGFFNVKSKVFIKHLFLFLIYANVKYQFSFKIIIRYVVKVDGRPLGKDFRLKILHNVQTAAFIIFFSFFKFNL